jgi:hypothetical protein
VALEASVVEIKKTAAELGGSRSFGGGDKKNAVSLVCLMSASLPTTTVTFP